MPDIREAKAFMREVGLSDAQLDVLRRASRKYENYHHDKNKLYNGEVSSYGVMSATLTILRERGLIAMGNRIVDSVEREKMEAHSNALITEAFKLADCHRAFDAIKTEDGDIVVWREVHSALSVAKGIYGKLSEKCLMVTETGRKVAADWKKIIGATEE